MSVPRLKSFEVIHSPVQRRVHIQSLCAGSEFRTLLTNRSGVVLEQPNLRPDRQWSVAVLFEGEQSEKWVHGALMVEAL